LVKLADHRLHAPEWLRVAIALLDRRPEACALLDRSSRIVAANSAFAALVERPAGELAGHRWAEACGVAATRALERVSDEVSSDEWLARTSEGVLLRLSVRIAPIAQTPAVLVSVVHWSVDEHGAPGVGTLSYEITRTPFGGLLWVRPEDGRPLSLDQPCFRALHGRDAPCPDCPARAVLRPGGTRVGVIVSGSGEPEIVSAQSVAKDAVRLTARRVDGPLFAELVEAKLAEQAGRAALTQREVEVLHLLTLGRAPVDVARALGFSVSTAKFHVHNVLRKLGAESRVDLLRVLIHGSHPVEPSEGPASESRRRVAEPDASDDLAGGGAEHGRRSRGQRGRPREGRRPRG
jgi:DNA-binding CsgD family transcriptional regulator